MADLAIWIPGKAPNLNDLLRMKGSRYKGSYNRFKKQWAARVATACRQLDMFAGALPMVRASVHMHVVEANMRRDPENVCSGSAKLILDGLVRAGIMAGDGWKGLAAISYSWSVDKAAPGIRVTLTEV